jgi:hypothetical protein
LTDFPLISSNDLANLIAQCSNDLRNGQGNKLLDLAGVMNAIADCNNKPYLSIFPQGIGGFATELMRSNSILSIPVLPEDVRATHSKIVKSATEQAITALEEMKQQLCNGEVTDYQKLMESLGIFFQQASAMSGQRRQFSQMQQQDE